MVEQGGAAGAGAGAESAGGADPFGFELFRNAIFAIADEMALTVCRTTYLSVLRDNMDFSTALTDEDGPATVRSSDRATQASGDS